MIARRAIVGTAGHVDHGKTTLVQALTGIDCDRLAEEKARGITIDLGFAWLIEDELQLGFVDVPGHERFVHNALAGFGGVGIALLVVAGDEGIRAQTREHLAILSLLGVRSGVVAITRCDLVDAEQVELLRLEIAELLRETPLAEASILEVSVVGDRTSGLESLRSELVRLGRGFAIEAGARPARLPIDRAFLVPGRGAVVTGTLVGGRIEADQELELVPSGAMVRVRTVEVHGESRPTALAGERVAVLVAGVELEQLRRGETLAAPGSLVRARSLVAEIEWLTSAPVVLAGWREAQLHLGTEEMPCRVRALAPGELTPGGRGQVEIRTRAPVAAARGDRLVLRRPSPAATLGGGTVLDPAWRPRAGASRAKALAALSREHDALVVWVDEAGPRGVNAEQIARRLGVAPIEAGRRLEALIGEARLLRLPVSPPRYVTMTAWKRLGARATRALDTFFEEHRLSEGMPRAELVQRLLGTDTGLAGPLLALLARQGILELEGDRVRHPGRKASTTRDEDTLIGRAQRAMEDAGIVAPSPPDLAHRLGAKPEILAGILKLLIERRILVRLPSGLITSSKALDRMVAILRAEEWHEFSIPAFKERFGLTRKWAVPLLEHFDKVGVTRRAGDLRQLLPASGTRSPTSSRQGPSP